MDNEAIGNRIIAVILRFATRENIAVVLENATRARPRIPLLLALDANRGLLLPSPRVSTGPRVALRFTYALSCPELPIVHNRV